MTFELVDAKIQELLNVLQSKACADDRRGEHRAGGRFATRQADQYTNRS